jgi:hypothetical protein
LAYLVPGENIDPAPIADQTIFQITSAQNGVFSGQNSVQPSIISPDGILQPGASDYTMSGVVTPAGQIRIQFTPTSSSASPVTGVGNMVFVEGAWRMTMQMAAGSPAFIMHWAYMTKPGQGESPPPPILVEPLGLRSWQWSWLLNTRWGITDSQVFGSSGGAFQIDGYRSGYFWGSGGGSTTFAVDGLVTPEGILFLVLTATGASPVTRTGTLQQAPTGQWQMVFRAYEGEAAVGAAALFSLLSPSQIFVTHLYNDILNREPDRIGMTSWTIQVEHGMNRSLVAYFIEQSQEARIVQVQNLYQEHLTRSADAVGLAGWVWFLSQGGTIGQIQAQILGSPEYYQTRGNGSPGGFITAIYDDLFQRATDPVGSAVWTQALAQGLSRTALATLLRVNPESTLNRAVGLYAEILQRNADPVGAAFLAQAMAGGLSDEGAVAYLAGSTEYFSR